MDGSDRHAARTAAFGVLVVAITAAVVSFSHVRAVAIEAGESTLASWLLPISIDGAVVAAVSVLLADSGAGRRPAPLTWLLLAIGLAASLAANVASAEPTATARAVAAWPPLALALGIEVLAGLARRSDPTHADAGAGLLSWHTAAAAPAVGSGNRPTLNGRSTAGSTGVLPVRQSTNGTGRSERRHPPLDDESAITLIRRLDARAATGLASRLEIQKNLGCGGSRAARLAELARRPVAEESRP